MISRHQLLMALLAASVMSALAQTPQIDIPEVDRMPRMPEPFSLRDWKKVARDFDAFAFDFSKTGEFLPLPWWDDSRVEGDAVGFALPAYVGDKRQTPKTNVYDAITCLGAVAGGMRSSIDKDAWAPLLKIYFSAKNGTNLYTNNPGGRSGGSFWYDLLPSILFYHVFDRDRSDEEMRRQFLAIADRWLSAMNAMDGNFDHTAFDMIEGKPVDNGRWKEPDAAAAVAWIEYMAYSLTGDAKYLRASETAMAFLDKRTENPFYECLFPYGAYLSVRMNAEQGTKLPSEKLINWVFDGTNARRWGVIAGSWDETEVSGLVGSVYEGSEYAFAMNSFLTPAAVVPIVRYDERYAQAIGKWMLNLAVNCRLFYPNAWATPQQSSAEWSKEYDPNSCIAYEGVRKEGLLRTRPTEALTKEKQMFWKMNVPDGREHTLVIELDPQAQVPKDGWLFETAERKEGPWTPSMEFVPGGETRRWHGVDAGSLWVRVSSAESAPRIGEIYTETRTGISPFATGDGIFNDWSKTDLALYGSAFVGFLGALVEPTDVQGILQIDCRATECFLPPSYPTYLFYNPFDSAKIIRLRNQAPNVRLYDTVRNRTVSMNATFEILADSAAVIVVCPPDGQLRREGRKMLCDDVVIDYDAEETPTH